MNQKAILGIDVGGTGIKGAIVDVESGQMLTEKIKIATPKPATPAAVTDTICQLIDHFNYKGIVGCGFPSVLVDGKVLTATNLDPAWIGMQLDELLEQKTGLSFTVINDADVAGVAEVNFGAAKHCDGSVIMITLGTGVGSGLLHNNKLLKNSELGFLQMRGGIAEIRVSNLARKKHALSWVAWGKRLRDYLNLLEQLFHPEIIVLGGGVCKKFDKFEEFTRINTPVVPAELENNAGCIGAAWYAYHHGDHKNK